MAFASWIYGTWGSFLSRKPVRIFGKTAAILMAALASLVIYAGATTGTATSHSATSSAEIADGWEPYSPERIAELQKKGIPVFIDFTAKWCLVCQANHLVLSTAKVEQHFKTKGVVKMKADWTKNDPRITEALRTYGRNSVPLYLLYSGTEGATPKILPQVLTPDVVVEHLGDLRSL